MNRRLSDVAAGLTATVISLAFVALVLFMVATFVVGLYRAVWIP